MNRRLFLRTAAALPAAAALSANVTASPQAQSHGAMKPVEVDIIDPASAEYLRDESVDVFARLEELDPGDLGQLSGCSLRILASGPLTAEVDALQRNGDRLSHCLGYQRLLKEGKLAADDAKSQAAALASLPEAIAALQAALQKQLDTKDVGDTNKASADIQQRLLQQGEQTAAVKQQLWDLEIMRLRAQMAKEHALKGENLKQLEELERAG